MIQRIFNPEMRNGVPELHPSQLDQDKQKALKAGVLLLDVRRPDEYNNELGHIAGAKLVTLGAELDEYLKTLPRETEIVFICRSGARSATATLQALQMGFEKPMNLVGGMIRWNELLLPVEREK